MLNKDIVGVINKAQNTIEHLVDNHHSGGLWEDNYLSGYCGIASRFLIELAKQNNISNMTFCYGTFIDNTHCWVEWNGFCIDLTISQFADDFTNLYFLPKYNYKICKINDKFYNEHYKTIFLGPDAIERQNNFISGQDYRLHATLIWKIYENLYKKNN